MNPCIQISKKLTLVIAFFLCSAAAFANSIDSLKTDNDVLRFMMRLDERFSDPTGKPLRILSTDAIRHELNCDSIDYKWNINNWEKADFNGDNKTDIIVTAYWYGVISFVAIDKGDNKFELIKFPTDAVRNCAFGKPIMLNSEQYLLFYRIRTLYKDSRKDMSDPFEDKRIIDTLVYKFGGFVEKNNNPASSEIKEIDFHVSYAWSSTNQSKNLKLLKDGTYSLITISKYPKKQTIKSIVDKTAAKEIAQLARYIDIKNLKNNYSVSWFDDNTMHLRVAFRDGSTKEITDYGLMGTFGLSQLYKLLFAL